MTYNLRRFLNMIAVDKAVFYGVLSRGWTAAAGVVTVFIVASFFSPELQGYYFTFNSLLALQIFFELGLAVVIIHFASHEWAKLGFDEKGNITGDGAALSRLRSLAKASFLWYFIGGVLLVLGLGAAGYVFFARSAQDGINWTVPWLALCFFTGVNMWLLPAFSLLEGSNQASQVYYYRFIQAVFRSLATWTIIVLGGKLWATVGAVFFPFFWTIYFLLKKYYHYFKTVFQRIPGPKLVWKKDVWPMQWRIAVSWLSQYLSFYLFTPVIFYFRGAKAAGQMGMSWSVVNALSLVAMMWVVARAPQFGILIAKKEYKELDRIFFRSAVMAVAIACIGSLVVYGIVTFLYAGGYSLAERFLPPLPTVFLLAATVLMQISYAQVTYLRAHKQEPFMLLSLVAALLSAGAIPLAAYFSGALGISMTYFCLVSLITVPWGTVVWMKCRRAWHESED